MRRDLGGDFREAQGLTRNPNAGHSPLADLPEWSYMDGRPGVPTWVYLSSQSDLYHPKKAKSMVLYHMKPYYLLSGLLIWAKGFPGDKKLSTLKQPTIWSKTLRIICMRLPRLRKHQNLQLRAREFDRKEINRFLIYSRMSFMFWIHLPGQ